MKRKSPVRQETLISRERLLQEFNMITLDDLAKLLDLDVKTLQNRRAPDSLPRYSKVGGKRLFFKADIIEWLRKHMKKKD
jgi:hypothetical protein